MDLEIRSIKGELRAVAGFKLEGIAARYGTRSSNLGGFIEQIAPGAFTRSLKAGAKVVVTKNHDPNFVLGNTKSGTATVFDSPEGLRFSVQLDKSNTTHVDTYASVKRGDLDSCSFAFKVPAGGDAWENNARDDSGAPCQLRTLKDVDLVDVAVVCYPAYPVGTSVDARSLSDKGLLRVAPRQHRTVVQPTEEFLAAAQGLTVPQLRAASDRAKDSVMRATAKRLGRQIIESTDADLRARAKRAAVIIANDAVQFKSDEAMLERMQNAAGISAGKRKL